MRRAISELKIMGTSPIFLLTATIVVFSLLAVFAGGLLNLSCIGFEVIFPFLAVIGVGEWGRLRADDNFDAIAAQGRSLFQWVFFRFAAVFSMVGLTAGICMAIVFFVRHEMLFGEMVFMYISPAMFLSTLAVLLNLHCSQEHVTTLICGVVWLVTMLIRSLLRIPGVEYVYLFIRYAGDPNGVWLINKLVLLLASGIMWGVIYGAYRNRKAIRN